MEPRFYRRKVRNRILWYFYVTDTAGKRIFRSTGKTRRWEAEEYVKAYLKEREKPSGSSITLSEYAKSMAPAAPPPPEPGQPPGAANLNEYGDEEIEETPEETARLAQFR